ncbi:putative hydrolase of the HAD superfamily [Devosia crocina]|uniref:Putative hydrolase of the HAD superfamily n=1 Tax=Devosia crocina TaxID=429728 RepID=A0A1I7N0W1_9HYPH|nr:pyrimidine 5'-nucleotidase [Devosia crocina]SFV28235.1 putative hydrolase of the HAD superfamily [Devosia crocina]
MTSLSHITDWVFDLDNTLYPRECNLFAQIDRLITSYVMDVTRLEFEEARLLQKTYYRDFGTTLNGLMHRHEIDPDHFLNTVHAIDYSPVAAHPDLMAAIRALPGRKFILTNGDTGHARSVLGRLGDANLFENVYDIRSMTFVPKPHRQAYEGFFKHHDIDPQRAIMFDDLEKNLVVPHEMGMATVQVVAGEDFTHDQVEPWEIGRSTGPHVHYVTSDLAGFLRNLD